MDPDRAKRIETLLKHPAWPDLEAEVEEVVAKYHASLAASLLRGDAVDQRSVDVNRGIIKGMQHLVKFPSRASRVVDRVLSEEREPVE